MKILVTGAAGFIGFHLCKKLLECGHTVVGLDNINNYYDVTLKYSRLAQLGISNVAAQNFNVPCESNMYGNRFHFVRTHLENQKEVSNIFKKYKFEIVCSLAAQAGVRYSIENPDLYIKSNITGYFNILECCRHFKIKHFIYASSSSVYGLNTDIPYKIEQKTDKPISLYAATKKSNELMAHSYSHLYNIPTTGLRFFTVYGPWGRPDMALFLFTDAIQKEKPIKIFNNGKMERDFTFINDVVEGVNTIINQNLQNRINEKEFYKIYNLGNSKPVMLTKFIAEIESCLGKKAIKHFKELQPGDMVKTYANMDDFNTDFGNLPKTKIKQGVKKFVDWYLDYNIERN